MSALHSENYIIVEVRKLVKMKQALFNTNHYPYPMKVCILNSTLRSQDDGTNLNFS